MMDVFISSGTSPVCKDKLVICVIGSANLENISLIGEYIFDYIPR